jgi:hypothetical protein
MSQETQYGPQNPHPLSRIKTERVWEGKYDEYGRRREVDEMPMRELHSYPSIRRGKGLPVDKGFGS